MCRRIKGHDIFVSLLLPNIGIFPKNTVQSKSILPESEMFFFNHFQNNMKYLFMVSDKLDLLV